MWSHGDDYLLILRRNIVAWAVTIFSKTLIIKVRAQLAEHGELVSVQLFSALKHTGHQELIAVLNAWLTDDSVYDHDDEHIQD